MKKLLLIPLVLLLLAGCSSDKWLGFDYPDGYLSCTEDYIFS